MAQKFKVGGFATDNPEDFIQLWGIVASTDRRTTLRKAGEVSGYQVSPNKDFYICKIRLMSSDTLSAGPKVSLAYGDTDVGLDSVSVPTNAVPIIGDTENASPTMRGGLPYTTVANGAAQMAASALDEGWIFKAVPSNAVGKFLYMRVGSINLNSHTMHITGFERTP